MTDSTLEAPHFGDARAEYQAGRSDAALFDVSDRAQIELTGADRAKFLHNFCTNDIQRLQPGEGCEAFITNIKGRVLGHVFVFAGAESIQVETVAGAGAPLIAHLDRYLITEDVALRERTVELGELFISGPRAAPRLSEAGIPAERLARYAHLECEAGRTALAARRVDLLGSPGYLVCAPREQLAELWDRLSRAGLRPAGREAFHALRIEAGMPLYGIDITEENLAQEVARTNEAISFTKGCYLGQEPIARIDALGHVNRELRGLRLEAGPLPGAGARVLADGKEVGRITSSAVSFADDRPVALAYLRGRAAAAGTEVRVEGEGDTVPAVVFERPVD